LRPGDAIGVTAPSAGVQPALWRRFEFCVQTLRDHGYTVVIGQCLASGDVVSAPAERRAAELQHMLCDPAIRAVVPPWGGELAVEVLPHLDFSAIAAAAPTWRVGFSDISTLLLPLTLQTGVASVHGQNLMDTPYRVPDPLLSWLDVVTRPPGDVVTQGPSTMHRPDGFDDWTENPEVTAFALDTPGTWRTLESGTGEIHAEGRLIGGCIETVSTLAGTRYGDVRAWAETHAPEGVIVYVEACEDAALTIARDLWRLRLAGWFDHANAVLVGRTRAPASGAFTQEDAVRSSLAGLDIPVVLDVDCGHVPPHLALVNGAMAEVSLTPAGASLVQRLVP